MGVESIKNHRVIKKKDLEKLLNIKFNEKTDNGWVGYSTKEITCNTDNVDWESFYRVC